MTLVTGMAFGIHRKREYYCSDVSVFISFPSGSSADETGNMD